MVEHRERLGDIEVNLMIGKDHKSALLVITDRATLLTAIEKFTSRKAKLIAETILSRLSQFSVAWIKTLTFGNDKAFATHQQIADELDVKIYFTRPYTSQDEGTMENRIWVIKRFFPKGTALRKVEENRIKTVERYLNIRPIRKFDYLSPIQQTLKRRAVALVT